MHGFPEIQRGTNKEMINQNLKLKNAICYYCHKKIKVYPDNFKRVICKDCIYKFYMVKQK